MRERNLILLFFILSVFSLVGFYYIGGFVNYAKHLEIKQSIVNHPEFIPSSKLVKGASAGFENLVSDSYWLSAIQYIGSNAVESEYKKYLYVMLDLVTDLNPNFTYPYYIGELLLSSYNERYEKGGKDIQKMYDEQARDLGLKGISKLCDANKVKMISEEYDLKKLWTDPKYKNPCIDPNIPYFLAYIYYWNFFDGKNSSIYYKVTSANENAPTGSRIMAAIMQGKSGDRQKSVLMFLSIAESLGTKNTKACQDFSSKLRNELAGIYNENVELDSSALKLIEAYRQKIISLNGDKKIDEGIKGETDCTRYLNKAIREINLTYIEKNDEKYFKDKKIHASSAKNLFSEGYIDYLPQDYQYSKDLPVNYFYNIDTGHWDNKTQEY